MMGRVPKLLLYDDPERGFQETVKTLEPQSFLTTLD